MGAKACGAPGGVIGDGAGAWVSDSAKELISLALTVDRAARASADDVLNHRWLQMSGTVSTDALPSSVAAAVRSKANHRKSLAARHVKTWSNIPRV